MKNSVVLSHTLTSGSASDSKSARCRIHPCHYLYVRKVAGRKYQARAWLALPLGSINLGLYYHEREAWIAARAWIQAGGDPVKNLPAGILPKWVVADPSGSFFARRASSQGQQALVLGPFDSAAEAHQAMLVCLKRMMCPGEDSGQPKLLEVCA